MSASPYLELVNRRDEQVEIHVLFIGQALKGTKKVFKRDNDPVKCSHVNSASEALDAIIEKQATREFDCVMVDMRHEEDGSPLNVVGIAALEACRNIVVLCNPDQVETFEAMTGVDTVLPAPVEPMTIIRTIVACAPEDDSVEEEWAGEECVEAVAEDARQEDSETPTAANDDTVPQRTVTNGFETSISKVAELDQQVWQRFVPVANFVYKKLAIGILSALFLAFLVYGAMIVFFMTSSGWSLPFELSRGHAMVERTERGISSLRLRQNQVRQELAIAENQRAVAARDERDGKLQLVLLARTVRAEIKAQEAQKFEIAEHIRRLKQVIGDFNRMNSEGGFARDLEAAFAKRLITRKSMNSGTLAVLETMHRIATVENEIAAKQLEADRVDRRLEFLETLYSELGEPELRVVTSAGSDLAHLAQEAIEAKSRVAAAQRMAAAAEKTVARQENSLQVVTSTLDDMLASPLGRAIENPVTVLFVPYGNTERFEKGRRLYGCWFSIIVCSEVAVVGEPVQGETNAVHPLFGKPMRGTFVEADFSNPDYITEELIHAGRAPLLF